MLSALTGCSKAEEKPRTPLDDVYDNMQLKRQAYMDLVSECEAALKDAWAISIRANLMKNKQITLSDPMVASIMGETVKVRIATNPSIFQSAKERQNSLWVCIKQVLDTVWSGKGPSEIETYGFRFEKEPMLVFVDGYIFELALCIGADGSDMRCFSNYDQIDSAVDSKHDGTRKKMKVLWDVLGDRLGMYNHKYDCATAAFGNSSRFDKKMVVEVGNGQVCRLRLLKLRTPL
jgi:hypothetical protein